MLRKICAVSACAAYAFVPTAANSQAVEQLPPIVIEGVQPRGQQRPATFIGAISLQQTTAGPVQGYRALTAATATRTHTPIEQIPSAIVVIPRSVIDDQFNLSVTEVIRNVSGVQGSNTTETPAAESLIIRGFRGETWVDGIMNYNNGGDRDSLVNVERIEVLKGANAILYGNGFGGPFGGAVNLISKLPQNRAFSEFGLTVGSRGYVQPYFDINQPLTKEGTVLFRITGEYTSSNSFIQVLDLDKYNINPTLTFTNNNGTSLTLQGKISNWKQQEYQGLPATGTITGPFRIDRNLYVGPADIPRSQSDVKSLTAKFDHEFNPIWSTSIQARFGKSEYRQYAQNFADVFAADFTANSNPSYAPTAIWDLVNGYMARSTEEAVVNAHLLAKFQTGVTKNKLLVGFDYSRMTDRGVQYADVLGGLFTDLTNPTFPAYVQPVPDTLFFSNIFGDSNNRYVTKGLYTQLQSTWWDRLHLVGGLRLASVEIDSISGGTFLNGGVGTTDITDKTKVLPRIGAVYDIVKGFSVFASYSEGMRAVPFVVYAGPPQPEESEQVEAGIKFNIADQLTGQLAIFQIERKGVPVNIGGFTFAQGEQRSRGFEADLIWQPTRNWQFVASYAHVDAELANGLFAAPAGNKINLVAPDSGRVWANYRFDTPQLRGFSVGLGVYASSGAFLDLANTYKTDGFFTIDAKVSYETPTWIASLIFKNLTREQYSVPYNYYGGRIAPGDDFAVYGKFAVKFGK